MAVFGTKGTNGSGKTPWLSKESVPDLFIGESEYEDYCRVNKLSGIDVHRRV